MWYKKENSDYGDYVDAQGARVALYSASSIICPPGQTPEENGWHEFESEEACLAAWGLEVSTRYEVRSTKFEECAPDGAEDY